MMTRDQHVAWCKRRALIYLENCLVGSAVASMWLDLGKHPEISIRASSPFILAGVRFAAADDRSALRRWIKGYR
jgi:hypothetical protein